MKVNNEGFWVGLETLLFVFSCFLLLGIPYVIKLAVSVGVRDAFKD